MIAYEKSAAVLRMIESYVGSDVFRKGVNRYLRTYAYGNATSEDFWTELTRASGRPVGQIMATFIDRPGYPLIDLEARVRTGANSAHAVTAAVFRRRRCLLVPGAVAGARLFQDGGRDRWAGERQV